MNKNPDRKKNSVAPQPENSNPRGDALVMFGLTGDLGEKKLFPSLVQLTKAGKLGIPVIGVGRSERTDAEVREMLADAVPDAQADLLDSIDLSYLSGDSQESETYDEIVDRLGDADRPVIYAAIPPDLFEGVARGMASSKMSAGAHLVVEKPFGDSAKSARELHDRITEHLDPAKLFAVDHFLAKSSVENLQTFRSANPMIDTAMRTGVVSRVEITMAESFGVDGRGSFYDGVGAMKDVVQNHLLQLIAIFGMESPADDSAEAFDDARAELLRAVQPFAPSQVVYGQFDGYLDIEDVAEDSRTETFVAAEFAIDNARWRKVPFYLRTGKEMAMDSTEVVAVFGKPDRDSPPNRLRFSIKPEATIGLDLAILDWKNHGLAPQSLEACAPMAHGILDDYAVMLDGALSGDHRHFARIADIVAAWRIVDEVIASPPQLHTYRKGSMGPAEAADLIEAGWSDR